MDYTETRRREEPTGIPGLGLLDQQTAQPPQPPPTESKPKKGRKSKYALRKEYESATRAIRTQDSPAPEDRVYKAPTIESGGIPDPTQKYLSQAYGRPHRLPQPRRILIILDLNGTLLHRPSKKRAFHFVERPHAQKFLNYCLDTFHLAIWSSARPDNVQKMVAKLLTPEQCSRCLLIWARDNFGLSHDDYNSRVQCYKRLTRVWQDPKIAASHPLSAQGGRWDQTNTILVDDSLEKARSEPFNILPIPEFSGLANETAEVLPQVHDYLNELCSQADISRYMRERPFTLNSEYKLPST